MKPIERIVLIVLAVFSATAIAGYWFFGLHPENLARFPQSAGFYAHSFSFFAQTQVWLSGIVLFVILGRGRHFRWLTGFLAVYVLSLSSELLGTTTGFPFGDYEYSGLLGTKWFAHVPYLIPLSWFTMALPSFVLVERTLSDHLPKVARWTLAALLLTSWDLVLDPAMSFLVPYWLWGQAGSFYGMPWINLAGWFVTGFVLSVALSHFRATDAVEHVSSKTLMVYYAIVFALPAGMLIAAGHILLVVLVSIGIAGSMYAAYRWARSEESDALGHEDEESDRDSMDGRLGIIAERTGEYFEKHSRSFSFASGLFLPKDRMRVCRLYAFCRMSDDIADEKGLSVEERRTMFADWRVLVEGSFHGKASGVKWLDGLMADLRDHDLEFSTIEGLLDAIESDIEFMALETHQDLVTYSYGVASTVGVMMCHLFGEKEAWTQERAISLGLAMQLTNIYRDVGEDLRLGRVYLPTAWQHRYATTEADLKKMQAGSPLTDSYLQMMADLEGYANLAYRKAWEAIPTLSWRFGPSVAVAAEIYRGIHAAIRRNGHNNLTKRAYTNTPRKLLLATGALIRFSIEKTILSLQNASPSRAQHVLKTALEKARMSWMVPFLILFIHVVTLTSN
jgi:putative membrane protein